MSLLNENIQYSAKPKFGKNRVFGAGFCPAWMTVHTNDTTYQSI